MKTLLVLLAVCAFASAFAPRLERAVHEAEEEAHTEASTTAKMICAHSTPCAWSTYHRELKRIEVNITNTYCVCSADTSCKVTEDDTSSNVYVLRCRPAEYDDSDILGS